MVEVSARCSRKMNGRTVTDSWTVVIGRQASP